MKSILILSWFTDEEIEAQKKGPAIPTLKKETENKSESCSQDNRDGRWLTGESCLG